MEKRGSGCHDSFHLTALVGDDIGRSLLGRYQYGFFLLLGRTACRCKYDFCDSLLRDLAPICLSDSSQILYNPHFGTYFYLEKSKARAAPLPTNYPVLRIPDTISPIPTLCPLSLVQLKHALRSDYHIRPPLTSVKHKLFRSEHLRAVPF